MKKFIIAVSMFVMSVLIGPGTILASDITDAIYRADIQATNSSYTAMKVSAPFTWSVQSLLDGYYINSGFTNLALRDSNGQDIAFMPGWDTNPWMFYINQISQNSVLNYSLYTGGETAMGGKLAYFPDTAGMTIADASSLELENSFEIEISGYFDTIGEVGASPVLKAGGLSITIDAEQQISVGNYSDENLTIAGNSWEGTSCYGTTWYGQTFSLTNNVILSGFNLYCKKIGSPTGNLDYYLYATSGGLPTGSALASGSILASTVSTSAGLKSLVFTTPVSLTAATTYAVVFSCPSGTSSNRISYWYTNNSSYAGGQQISSNSGTSWTGSATVDIYITLSGAYLNPLVSASDVAAGEHIVKTNLSGGTINLYIDGVLADSAAFAGSISDNANNWVIGANGSMPYLYYAKITVGGVLRGSWAWEYSDTFTDLSGNGNDATPSFKTISTDADVSAAIISYNAYNLSALVVSGDDEGIQIIDDDEISDTPAGFFGALDPDRLEFLSPINEIISEAGIPLEFVWYPFIFGGGAAITMISFGVTRKLLPCIIAGGIWTGFLSAALGADLWTVLPFVVVAATELVNRKTVSL
ncbi:hypothetical protein SDC9_42708 [bioreactor metagenome]|uniref:Uncharacterized protein n=1 Tax=bioreactor metagenome TaxID=1076179 RepID=A0A644VYX9_9ZZZZ|nr:hypothetical protein [Dehalococcoides mccartyi]